MILGVSDIRTAIGPFLPKLRNQISHSAMGFHSPIWRIDGVDSGGFSGDVMACNDGGVVKGGCWVLD